jgi:hypothetical protein
LCDFTSWTAQTHSYQPDARWTFRAIAPLPHHRARFLHGAPLLAEGGLLPGIERLGFGIKPGVNLVFGAEGLLDVAGFIDEVEDHLSLSLGAASILDGDPLTSSVALLAGMLALSLAKANNATQRTNRPQTQSAIFLFLGTVCIIIFGFYTQAILECFINTASAGATRGASPALPAVSAIIPGSIAGYVVVFTWAAGRNWVKAGIRIFFVLAACDLFAGARGLTSFHDAFLSVLLDVPGAPLAAFIIFRSHDRLFRHALPQSANPAPASDPHPPQT